MGKRTWLRSLIPFPRRKTFKRWFPGFEARKTTALIQQSKAEWVIDIGANTGQFAQRLRATGYKGKILSVEPLPDEHAHLTTVSARDPAWTIAPRTAIGAESGEITIHRYADSSLSSALRPANAAKEFGESAEITTPLTSLDALVADHVPEGAPMFIKIDVQGLEMQVIAGGASVLDRCAGVSVELALRRIYQDEPGYLEVLIALDAHGLVPVFFSHVTSKRRMRPEWQMDALLLRQV
ncbi:MAG: FkbM family methyltransferase [Pseudomonadota bacterium]